MTSQNQISTPQQAIVPIHLQVGTALPSLVTPAINRITLSMYAGASGDNNPIHVDIDFARRAGMPDVFAHGMLSMAYMGRLLTNWIPQEKIIQFKARFVGITHVGNQLTCTAKVVEQLEFEGKPVLRIELCAATQYGDVKTLGDALIRI
jgi:acyl dehydratase